MSFFVTAIAYYPGDKECDKPWKRTRTFGHFANEIDAKRAVAENHGNMCECLYNYLVIEEIGYGIHALVEEDSDLNPHEWWFEWKDSAMLWAPIEKPEWSVGTSNWSIG